MTSPSPIHFGCPLPCTCVAGVQLPRGPPFGFDFDPGTRVAASPRPTSPSKILSSICVDVLPPDSRHSVGPEGEPAEPGDRCPLSLSTLQGKNRRRPCSNQPPLKVRTYLPTIPFARDRDTQGQSMTSRDMRPRPAPRIPPFPHLKPSLLSSSAPTRWGIQDIAGQAHLPLSWKFSFWPPLPLVILFPPRPR
jgi:hypothetical protein